MVTIFKGQDATGGFLKFRVEICYGDSAKMRPEEERGFQVRKETEYHRKFIKERESVQMSNKENNELATGRAGDAGRE